MTPKTINFVSWGLGVVTGGSVAGKLGGHPRKEPGFISERPDPNPESLFDTVIDNVRLPKGSKVLRADQRSGDWGALTPPTRVEFKALDASGDVGGQHDIVYTGRAHRTRSGRYYSTYRWANPFKIRACVSRHQCLERYRTFLRAQIFSSMLGCPQWATTCMPLQIGGGVPCRCAYL